jgi:hypothetical protein
MSTFSHSHNYFWTFQILPGILPAKKKETTEYRYHYQIQHVSETAKIFKYASEFIFHRTQLMATHNTVMTSNTNGVPPSETHMQISFTQCRTTVSQFKYWDNGASENMTMYMTTCTVFTIHGTNRNNFNTIKCTILQSYIVYIKHPNTASPQLTQVQVCNLQIQTKVLFGDAWFLFE